MVIQVRSFRDIFVSGLLLGLPPIALLFAFRDSDCIAAGLAFCLTLSSSSSFFRIFILSFTFYLPSFCMLLLSHTFTLPYFSPTLTLNVD